MRQLHRSPLLDDILREHSRGGATVVHQKWEDQDGLVLDVLYFLVVIKLLWEPILVEQLFLQLTSLEISAVR